jgi:hypothetical protein
MRTKTTLTEMDRELLRMNRWLENPKLRPEMRKCVTLFRRQVKQSLVRQVSPSGVRYEPIKKLPRFKKGDVWYTAEAGGAHAHGNMVTPHHIRTSKAARKANKAWNKRARERGARAPYRPRGAGSIPALYRPRGQSPVIGILKLVAKRGGTTRHGGKHVEVVGDNSMVFGTRNRVVALLAHGRGKSPARNMLEATPRDVDECRRIIADGVAKRCTNGRW